VSGFSRTGDALKAVPWFFYIISGPSNEVRLKADTTEGTEQVEKHR